MPAPSPSSTATTTPAVLTPAAALGALAARRAAGIFIRLEPVPDGWRCRVREDLRAGEWTVLEPPGTNHPTPEAAISAIDTAITEWLGAREQAVDAEVVLHLQRGDLERRPHLNEEGSQEERWAARRADGAWEEGHASPRAAVRAALRPQRGVSR